MRVIPIEEIKENVIELFSQHLFVLAVGKHHYFNAKVLSWGGLGWLWNKSVAFVLLRKDDDILEIDERITLSFMHDWVNMQELSRKIEKARELGIGKIPQVLKDEVNHRAESEFENRVLFYQSHLTLICKNIFRFSIGKFNDSNALPIIKDNYYLNDFEDYNLYALEIQDVITSDKLPLNEEDVDRIIARLDWLDDHEMDYDQRYLGIYYTEKVTNLSVDDEDEVYIDYFIPHYYNYKDKAYPYEVNSLEVEGFKFCGTLSYPGYIYLESESRCMPTDSALCKRLEERIEALIYTESEADWVSDAWNLGNEYSLEELKQEIQESLSEDVYIIIRDRIYNFHPSVHKSPKEAIAKFLIEFSSKNGIEIQNIQYSIVKAEDAVDILIRQIPKEDFGDIT